MTLKIYKYPLKVQDEQVVKMPIGADILCVELVKDIPCLYALVNSEADEKEITIEIFGTGHDIEILQRRYIGTFKQLNDSFVGHVFQRFIQVDYPDPTLC